MIGAWINNKKTLAVDEIRTEGRARGLCHRTPSMYGCAEVKHRTNLQLLVPYWTKQAYLKNLETTMLWLHAFQT